MTTTLRPTEPLQQNPDGTRSRRYRVCVNGLPVGRVHISTHPVFRDAAAQIMSLWIEEPARRRGRGTLAALAAEEIARDWGCRRIEAVVPAEGEGTGRTGATFRIATALGYVVRNYTLEKALGDTSPTLPEGSRGRLMTGAEYDRWSVTQEAEYARSWTERGVPEVEALAKAAREHAALLPDGRDSEGVIVSVLEHEGTPVGTLWLSVRAEHAFVFDVKVGAEHRGRGHGRSLMLLAEAQAISAGKRGVGLNVFAGNTPAERLYASLGYGATQYTMYKHLP